MPWSIELEGKLYVDNVDIIPEDLYTAWHERKVLPKSGAPSPYDFQQQFRPFVDKGLDVVHIDIGSGLSTGYDNAVLASREDGLAGHVYVVDSQNLSTGIALLVIQAAKLAQQGMPAAQIAQAVSDMHARSHASFLLDTLEFMQAGGRCSSVMALGASMLKIKPCIEVDNCNGADMRVGRKYHGSMEKCLKQYVHDKLDGATGLDLERIFITHSGAPQEHIDLVYNEIKQCQDFKNIEETRASCLISTHCGPGTLGILYMTK